MIDGKTILITGGTGSFGQTIVEKLLNDSNPKKIIIFSRDEKKQFDMRNNLDNEKLEFIIGDIRDRNKIFNAINGTDIVFHAAALKQVPTCEFFPMEAVKTNIIGSNNVLDASEKANIEKVIVLSTDKAVYPLNSMGISKAMLEKLMLAKARNKKCDTIFCGVRYGNVMYSRGSVIPLFIDQIRKGKPLTITNPDMTRFMLPLPLAIDLVLFTMENGKNGDISVRKSPAAAVKDVANAVLEIFNSNVGTKIIGIREGEKMHETLTTREELIQAEDLVDYYRIQNLMQIDYDKYFIDGKGSEIPEDGYTSENTERLNKKKTKDLILSLPEIKRILDFE